MHEQGKHALTFFPYRLIQHNKNHTAERWKTQYHRDLSDSLKTKTMDEIL